MHKQYNKNKEKTNKQQQKSTSHGSAVKIARWDVKDDHEASSLDSETPPSNTSSGKLVLDLNRWTPGSNTHRDTHQWFHNIDDRPRHLRVRTDPGGCWSASASGRTPVASSSALPWPESPGERRASPAWRALPSRSQTWITATQSHCNTLQTPKCRLHYSTTTQPLYRMLIRAHVSCVRMGYSAIMLEITQEECVDWIKMIKNKY